MKTAFYTTPAGNPPTVDETYRAVYLALEDDGITVSYVIAIHENDTPELAVQSIRRRHPELRRRKPMVRQLAWEY